MADAEKEEAPILLVRLLLRGSLVLSVAVFLPIGSLLLLMLEERVEKRPLILLSVLLSCVLLIVILIFRGVHKKQAQGLSGALAEASRVTEGGFASAQKIGSLDQSLAAARAEIVAKNAEIQKLKAANESWRQRFEEGDDNPWAEHDDDYTTPPPG